MLLPKRSDCYRLRDRFGPDLACDDPEEIQKFLDELGQPLVATSKDGRINRWQDAVIWSTFLRRLSPRFRLWEGSVVGGDAGA